MKKVTAPAGPVVHGPENTLHGADALWWVHGEIYTDDAEAIARFADLGYPMEDVAEAPADYLTAVEWMKEKADVTPLDTLTSAYPANDAARASAPAAA